MTLTQEQKHARNKDNGQFGTIQRSENPEITLGAPHPEEPRVYGTFNELLAEQIGEAEIISVEPANRTEARRKLVNLRGEPGGAIRRVQLHAGNAPDSYPGEHVAVTGPKDGRPIVVSSNASYRMLRVTSGKAIVHFDSYWQNEITVADGAEAVVFGAPDRAITVTAEAGSKVTIMCPSSDNRFNSRGEGETTEIFGPPKPDVPEEPECSECGGGLEDDGQCLNCTCECGNTLNDGEGWNGKCGTCADRDEDDDDDDEDDDEESGEDGGDNLFDMELEDASGETSGYRVNKCGDGHYEVTSDLDDPLAEFYLNCDEEDHSELQSAAIKALREAGIYVIDPEDELVAPVTAQAPAAPHVKGNDPDTGW